MVYLFHSGCLCPSVLAGIPVNDNKLKKILALQDAPALCKNTCGGRNKW